MYLVQYEVWPRAGPRADSTRLNLILHFGTVLVLCYHPLLAWWYYLMMMMLTHQKCAETTYSFNILISDDFMLTSLKSEGWNLGFITHMDDETKVSSPLTDLGVIKLWLWVMKPWFHHPYSYTNKCLSIFTIVSTLVLTLRKVGWVPSHNLHPTKPHGQM